MGRPGGGGYRLPPDEGRPRQPNDGPATDVAGPPPAAARVGPGIVGQVRGLQVRTEPYNAQQHWTIWSFRIERFDEAGNRELLVPVEMRGFSFDGAVAEGDWLRVHGTPKDGTLRATRADNLTTGAAVIARDHRGRRRLAMGLFALFVAAWIVGAIAFAFVFLTADGGNGSLGPGSGPPPTPRTVPLRPR